MRYILILLYLFILGSASTCYADVDNINNMKKLADNGNSYAQYEVGKYYYEHGDRNTGINYLNRSCANKYNPACEYLAKFNDIPLEEIKKYTLDDGYKFYDSKDYRNAFRIFENYCNNYKNKGACIMLGISTRLGNGTTKDISKALNIFSSSILQDDEVANLQKAYIYEYEYGNSYYINNAMQIYDILKNSNNKDIAKNAIEGLERNKVYSFLEKVFIPYNAFFKDRINYDSLERYLMSVDTSNLPQGLKNAYLSWRLPFLKLASNKTTVGDTIWEIGKSAVKGFLLDFSFVGDALDNWNKDEKLKPLYAEEKHYYSLLIDQLRDLDISANFWNSLHGQ